MNPNDYQVDGVHYRDTPVQHWDVMADINANYFVGYSTKYLARYWKKNGRIDLEKCRHVLEKYNTTANVTDYYVMFAHIIDNWISHVVNDNRLGEYEKERIRLAIRAITAGDMLRALRAVQELINFVAAEEPGPHYVCQD